MDLAIHSLTLSSSPVPLARARGDRSPLIGWGSTRGNVPSHSFPHPLPLPSSACPGAGGPISSHWLGEHEGECTFPLIRSPSPLPLSRLHGRRATDHLSLAGGA